MPRPPVTIFACLALAGGGVLAGCGDDDTDTASTPAAPPAAAAPSASGEVKVTMQNIKFVPEAITVKVGQKIVWENTDGDIPHTVTATDGADFDSGNMKADDTFDYTPAKTGKIAYVCTIHSGQNGSITITK